ncbi:MHS family MFS transporter [Acinetobacter bohemicus]|jgi:MHS family shikimate/dehydroshikimate transporter-like MFS transporter|uniref:Metabolite-proton symporter n=1 Tax=Acinetobacter bohemicus TaxID=1435036 RepID=A0A1I6VMN8_9GAMM|nr:MFS transporter [Acinetobacter bohemicus]KAB0651168.1 MHS family MFS transporter [Acinetobacter bohemicus]SFT14963.1 metabolite-proton symporter [Acinetobacter bohemicus]
MKQVQGTSLKNKKSAHRLAGISSMVGTTIEWYDFFIYGAAAALIFNKLFFPNLDPLMGVMAAFATYAVGFIGRPLGGIVFGHFGDKVGRKSMLLLTLVLMGIPTVLIGLLPTYESIGYWATFFLVILRFIQGMAMGGEWGGAVLMAVEHAPEGGKGFWGSLPQASAGGGLMLASIALGLVSLMPEQILFSWGWRLPFLASIVLLAIGWYIRVKVPESPDFEKIKEKAEEIKVPALQVFKNHPKELVTIIIARAAENAWFYIASTFALAYTTTQLGIPRQNILFATICGGAMVMFMTPLCGHLSDKVGQRNMFMFGLILLALYCYPFFSMLNTKDPFLVWTTIVVAIGVVFPVMYAPQSQLFARQFPAEIRYSGISISVQFAGVLGGGLAPLIATKLLSIGQGSPHLISIYILSMAIVAIICTCFMKRDQNLVFSKKYIQTEV